MFVTDTTDAGYPPEEEYNPEAIMDRLAEILSQTQFHNHSGIDIEKVCHLSSFESNQQHS